MMSARVNALSSVKKSRSAMRSFFGSSWTLIACIQIPKCLTVVIGKKGARHIKIKWAIRKMSGRFVQDVAALILSTWQTKSPTGIEFGSVFDQGRKDLTRIALSQGHWRPCGRTSLKAHRPL